MKVLFIGGTGIISSACSELAVARGMELFLLNRGQSKNHTIPAGAQVLNADVQRDEARIAARLREQRFDAVVDWIAYTVADVERDIRLFAGKTSQFIFISSASVYQKPPTSYLITEDAPLANPYWDYSRAKIACEERLMKEYRDNGFPFTIVRPSHTYGPTRFPLAVHSSEHPYTIADRMKRGQKVLVPGDGSSLWTVTYHTDFAKGLVGLLGREQTVGHAFHITSDEALAWDQIYRELGHAIGVEPNLVHIPSELIAAYIPRQYGNLLGDKTHSAVFDNRKIKRFVPDYVATVPWAVGVRKILDWFAADPARCTIDSEANALWDSVVSAYESAFPKT